MDEVIYEEFKGTKTAWTAPLCGSLKTRLPAIDYNRSGTPVKKKSYSRRSGRTAENVDPAQNHSPDGRNRAVDSSLLG